MSGGSRAGWSLLGLALLGCPGRGTGSGAEGDDPRRPVREYFAAVASSDCERLRASLTGPALARFDDAGCEDTIEEFRRHGASLSEVGQVRPDGRNGARRLVSVQLRIGEGEQAVVVGVRLLDDGWRIDEI